MSKFTRWLWFNLAYLRRPRWDTGISPPELLDLMGKMPPGRAIDLGCGTGTNLLALARAGWQVTGVDFAVQAVNAARQKLAAAGLSGEVRAGSVADIQALRRPDRSLYNLVLDIGCYHGLTPDTRAAYRRNLPEIIAPGGTFLLYAHWKQEPSGAMGIDEQDLAAFCAFMRLENRQDSLDHWSRKATWMRFER